MKNRFILITLAVILSGCSVNNKYSKFLSTLSDLTYYAVDTVSGQEVLFISNDVYGENAISASLYIPDDKGDMYLLGQVISEGTLYPISISNGTLLDAGHHFVMRYEIKDSALYLLESAEENYDVDGQLEATYENRLTNEYYNYRPEENNKLKDLFAEFEKARPVVFKPCKASSETVSEDHILVRPLPPDQNLYSLSDADVAAQFTNEDFNWMGGNLKMDVYSEQLYDAVDVSKMQLGDTIMYTGDTIIIKQKEDSKGQIVINGGIENGGVNLWPYEGGTYRAVQFDDHSVYVKLGHVELPLNDDFTIIDCHENPQDPYDTIKTDQKLYLETLKGSRKDFSYLNTRVRIEKGLIVNITRIWIP